MSRINFIRTTDLETYQKLKEAGFTELQETGVNGYVFINDRTMKFNDEDISKLKYSLTNKLCI